jgi:secondary thiamine-phosphate synthase enzyme
MKRGKSGRDNDPEICRTDSLVYRDGGPLIARSQPAKNSHRVARRVIELEASRRTHLVDITSEIQKIVAEAGCATGSCHLYVPHTTAGIIVNEGDDPDVGGDIEATLDRLAPREASYRHREGNSDSHIKCALTGVSQTVLVEDGRLALGRWQAVFFCEFDGPRRREVRVKIASDPAD